MMANEWILDVLADLTDFAEKNGLPALERQLRSSAEVAALEVASVHGMAHGTARRGLYDAGSLHRAITGGRNL